MSRTTVLTVVSVIEIAVILFFLARWYGRRWGWRTTAGRIRAFLLTTAAELIGPPVRWYRFGRDIRRIADQLDDPGLGDLLRSATSSAEHHLVRAPDCLPYAVVLGPDSVGLALTRFGRPEAGLPWRERDGWWLARRDDFTRRVDEQIQETPIGYVLLGIDDRTFTLLDLLCVPGVLEVRGPDRPVASLICAVSAQLSSGLTAFEDLDVIVASGLHPRFDGPTPLSVLRDLDRRERSGSLEHRFTVLLCGPLNDAECDLLADLSPRLPLLRVVLAGPYAGKRWKLEVTEDGRVEAPELRLSTGSAPLEYGVARALRRGGPPPRPVRAVPATPPVVEPPPVVKTSPVVKPPPASLPAAPPAGRDDLEEPDLVSPATGELSQSASAAPGRTDSPSRAGERRS